MEYNEDFNYMIGYGPDTRVLTKWLDMGSYITGSIKYGFKNSANTRDQKHEKHY